MGAEQLGNAIHFLTVGSRGKELAEATAIEDSQPTQIFCLKGSPSCLDLGDGGSRYTKLRSDVSLGETA